MMTDDYDSSSTAHGTAVGVWAVRPCLSSEPEYRKFMKDNFTGMEAHENDEFIQRWGYRGSLKNGVESEVSLDKIYAHLNPFGELNGLYNRQAPVLINKIYNIAIGSTFYSVHKNHLWKCMRVGEYVYDSSKDYPHGFKAKIVKILDVEAVSYNLKNTRPTVTTITFN